MHKAFVASALAFLGLAAVPAAAMPIAPLDTAPPGLTTVAFGCGPGWTRGPYGGRHPMGRVYAPRPAYGYAYGYLPYPYARHCWWRAGVRICN